MKDKLFLVSEEELIECLYHAVDVIAVKAYFKSHKSVELVDTIFTHYAVEASLVLRIKDYTGTIEDLNLKLGNIPKGEFNIYIQEAKE